MPIYIDIYRPIRLKFALERGVLKLEIDIFANVSRKTGTNWNFFQVKAGQNKIFIIKNHNHRDYFPKIWTLKEKLNSPA